MIRWLIRRQLDAVERRLGASVEYLRYVAGVSLRAFVKFLLIGPAAGHRRVCPREMLHAARIAAAQSEDCGPCVQIAVNLALADGVDAALIRSIVDGDPAKLPEDAALAYRFAKSVADRTGDDNEWRRRLRARFADEVIVELALAVAMARVFPTFKRGLGYAQSCSLVTVPVAADAAVAAATAAARSPER